MHACMHTYMRARAHTHTHTRIFMHTHRHMHTYIADAQDVAAAHINAHINAHAHTHLRCVELRSLWLDKRQGHGVMKDVDGNMLYEMHLRCVEQCSLWLQRPGVHPQKH